MPTPPSLSPDPPVSPQLPLLGASLENLTDWVQRHQQPAYRGKQLHQWIYQQGARSLTDISVFPKTWRADLATVPIGRSTLHHRAEAPDGTVKFLLQLNDGHIIETVGIPTGKRLTVCVSSQVGCPMACDFCATGKGGFARNLARHEIVDQVLTVQEDFQKRGQQTGKKGNYTRVSNIVFMGMGEPLLNAEQVVAAVRCLNQDVGIGQRSMTISTVGVPGRIHRLAAQRLQVTLAVSLHASNQSLRTQLIPSAGQYPLEALLSECRDYVKQTGRRVTFEYILLADLNDKPEHAQELGAHLRGFQSHVNLIPYNPIQEGLYNRPSTRRIQEFVDRLRAQNITVSVRRSRGLEKDAACGQLRASHVSG